MGHPARPRDPANLLEGMVEIWAYKKGELIDYQKLKNIILYQGQAEILRAISITSPATTPRVITRMAIGDQGTIPADPTVPKVPVKTASGLFHEIYRKDVEIKVPTFYTPVGYTYTGNTTTGSNVIVSLISTIGLSVGMTISGTGVPAGAVITGIPTSTSVTMSVNATSSNSGTALNFAGTVNECQFIATFDAASVALTAFSNPSQPRVNEVGLIIIDPTASGGLVRSPVTSPDSPESDEVLMSVRTFKSVPFEAANDISITIKYTVYTE